MQGSVAGGVDAVEKIPVARIVEALENPGAEYQHNGMARRFPDIRFIWWPAAPTLLIIRTPTD